MRESRVVSASSPDYGSAIDHGSPKRTVLATDQIFDTVQKNLVSLHTPAGGRNFPPSDLICTEL